ncbi:energy transducer TonB [Chthoniobacter flavus]|uniref:energy transducer TonB n=1 Tax=Chthoniobacter flavus TaxID=191863 RepID=UPI0010473C95|nr:energy transducer TonB [Chthoniobacter flavus]
MSLSPGDNALVSEEFPAPQPAQDTAAEPVETSFAPPAPALEPTPVPMPMAESMPPLIATTAEAPPPLPVFPHAKKERASKTGGVTARRSTSSHSAAAGLAAGGAGAGGNYLPPHFLTRYKPPYPAEARAQRIEGVVMLLVAVDAEGRVTSASVSQGSGHAMLDRAALEAVHTWRFSPATQNGRPVSATVEIPIRFNFSA